VDVDDPPTVGGLLQHHRLGALDGQWLTVFLGVQLAFGSDPCELTSGACTLTEQLAMGALEECRIADCVMTQIFLAAALGTPGLEDEDVGSEQGFDRGQIAARRGPVETLRYGDRGLCSDWDVDVRRCRGSG
jgi:hypothetical protein